MAAPSCRASVLHKTLLDLHDHPFPHVPNPLLCKKRASVALILRIQPTFPDDPKSTPVTDGSDQSTEARLAAFFDQQWVRNGDPEALFIKRAARRGDRFTSHVAFPGGKRDPEDESDMITSIRETLEEVGIDLSSHSVIYIGNLAERIVTAEWGTVPLMVLCPFVFLVTDTLPPLRLQPAEVHSAHWVPLRALTAPSLAAYERADLSDRLTRQGGPIARWLCRSLVGQLMFGATKLAPSESVFCTSTLSYLEEPMQMASKAGPITATLQTLMGVEPRGSSDRERPMLLWGLTHGMMYDFLDLMGIASSWEWPTFSAPDVMFAIWLSTRRFRQQKIETIRPQTRPRTTFIVDEGLGTFEMEMSPVQQAIAAEQKLSRASAVSHLLLGYFQRVKRAVYVALITRTILITMLFIFAYRRRKLRLRWNR